MSPAEPPGQIGFTDLRARLREVIHEVEFTGRPLVITVHGRPAAALVPLAPEHMADISPGSAPGAPVRHLPAGNGR